MTKYVMGSLVDEGNAARAIAPDVVDDPWLFRPYSGSEEDRDAMFYLLSVAYSRTSAGRRAGADSLGRKRWLGRDGEPLQETPEERVAREARVHAFKMAHGPIWEWLLEHAEVTLAVDRERPETDVWGWLVTSGPDVLHAVGCKRSVIKAGLGEELVGQMVGDRWKRFQVLTLEMPGLCAPGRTRPPTSDQVRLSRPHTWSIDPTWLLTRMVGR